MINQALLLAFPMAMAFAAANDLFTMRIPNKISMLLVAAFAVTALLLRLPLDVALTHLGIGAAVLAAGFVLFSLRLLGGGDAKLMAAGALWMGSDQAVLYIAMISLFGGLLSLAFLAYRKFVPAISWGLPSWALRLHVAGSGIPYGIAIAAAGLALYPSTILFHALQG